VNPVRDKLLVLRPELVLGQKRSRRSLWDRLTTYSFTKSRRSRKHLARFCSELATDEYTLVVHSVDVDHTKHFPNSFVIGKHRDKPANLYTDPYYLDLRLIGDASFNVALCTGLLEHIPDPARLVEELHRILKPGGRLIVSASAVFPFHGSPDNFFHYTPNGFRLLFKHWSHFEVLRGSSQPFATIAILLQRVNIQCDIFPPVRLLIEFLYHTVPLLDYFILRQYESNTRRDETTRTDTMMPALLYAVVVK
jgi:SAM-dependent methyltransferase